MISRKPSTDSDPAWSARALVVQLGTDCTAFTLRKLERGDLYVTRRRVALDGAGQPCQRASLTRDGLLLRAGMTAQGYVAGDGRWVPQKALTGIGPDGQALPLADGTLGVPQRATEATAQELLDLHVTSVYRLTAVTHVGTLSEQLEAGKILRVPFNYRADFRAETAFVVSNAQGVFAVVGVPTSPAWLAPDVVPPPPEVETELDDLDFDMTGGAP